MRRSFYRKNSENSKHRVRMNSLLSEAVRDVAAVSVSPGARLKCIPTRLIHYVHANPEQITVVLRNLMLNAVHLAGDGGTITIRQSRLKGKRHNDKGDLTKICFRVAGKGISEDMLGRLSDRFNELVDMLSNDTGSTTELPLAKCRQIARSLGGNVWVKGQLGRGLSFFMTLPLIAEVPILKTHSVKKHPLVTVVKGTGDDLSVTAKQE